MDAMAMRFGLLNIGGGLLIIALSLPLLLKLVPRNCLYGFLFAKARRSKEDWYAVNSYGAKQLIRCSSGTVGCGLLLLLIPFDAFYRPTSGYDTLFVLAALAPIVLPLMVALLRTGQFAAKE